MVSAKWAVPVALCALASFHCGSAPQQSGRAALPKPSVAQPGREAACAAVGLLQSEFNDRVAHSAREGQNRVGLAPVILFMEELSDASAQFFREIKQIITSDAELQDLLRKAEPLFDQQAKVAASHLEELRSFAGAADPIWSQGSSAFKRVERACMRDATRPTCVAVAPLLGKYTGVRDADPAVYTDLRDEFDKLSKTGAGLAEDLRTLSKTAGKLAFLAEHTSEGLHRDEKATDKLRDEVRASLDAFTKVCGDAPLIGLTRDFKPADFRSDPKPNARKLTLLIHVKPSEDLSATLDRLAKASEEGPLRDAFNRARHGGFGSGFPLVDGRKKEARTYLLTAAHVVAHSDEVDVELDGGKHHEARVEFVDPRYDVAVLTFAGQSPFEKGFAISVEAPTEQQTVIATGFPGLGGNPSYQSTRGYVSNARFVHEQAGRLLSAVQHTAPIDPGSSGGPLTDEKGSLIGLNSFKAIQRENVAFAIPVPAILNALAAWQTSLGSEGDPTKRRGFRQRSLRRTCLDLLSELGSTSPRTLALRTLISRRYVAAKALGSLSWVAQNHAEQLASLTDDPLGTVEVAVFQELIDDVAELGGPSPIEICSIAQEADTSGDSVVLPIRLLRAGAELTLQWERGRYALSGFRIKE